MRTATAILTKTGDSTAKDRHATVRSNAPLTKRRNPPNCGCSTCSNGRPATGWICRRGPATSISPGETTSCRSVPSSCQDIHRSFSGPIRLEEMTATVSAPMNCAESRIASTSPRSGIPISSSSPGNIVTHIARDARTDDVHSGVLISQQHGRESWRSRQSRRRPVQNALPGRPNAFVQVFAGRVPADEVKGQGEGQGQHDKATGKVGASCE